MFCEKYDKLLNLCRLEYNLADFSIMINPRISADWSTTKPIAAFSCTPGVQEVHTKAKVAHLTPGLLGFRLLFNFYA